MIMMNCGDTEIKTGDGDKTVVKRYTLLLRIFPYLISLYIFMQCKFKAALINIYIKGKHL